MTRVIEQFFDYFSRFTGIMMEQRILGAVVIMALFAILAILVDFFIHRIVNYISQKSKVEIDTTFIGSIHRPAWIIILLIGALMSVMWLNLDQQSNFFGGMNIFLDKPFATGDYIILESGERGEVVDIGVRSTLIRTRDDEQISIPNSIVANTKIINESAPEPRYRVRLKVGVAYNPNLEQVEAALLKVANASQSISHDPEARVRLRAFGDSSLEFELLCWAKTPADRGRVIHELNSAIFEEFKKENISIPFPQRDVYMHPRGQVGDVGGEVDLGNNRAVRK